VTPRSPAAHVALKADSRFRVRHDKPAPPPLPLAHFTSNAHDPAPAPARRSNWRAITFVLAVLLPSAITAVYLYDVASDQYVSEFRFRVRHAQTSTMEPASALGGLAGGATAALQGMIDSEIVVQYLQSRQVLDDLQPLISIEHVYARPEVDWLARLLPNAPVEDRLRYWRGVVDPFFDMATGIITVKVRAFDRNEAQQVSAALLSLSENLVNSLSERAVSNKLSYARREVEQQDTAMRKTELALREFRNNNDVLFPTMRATEATELDGKLQSEISMARAAVNALRTQGVDGGGPRMRLLENRISGLQTELSQQQTRLTRSDAPSSAPEPKPLASTLASYEALDLNAKITAKAYELAIMAEQRARDEASQQQIYLDTFVTPAVPERSMYPVRWRLLLQVSAAALVLWCLGTLLWRTVLDHID
jgi:capsular polysaccharide transport system permease protein